jgi:hypothetical protein
MLAEAQPKPDRSLKVQVCCKFCCKSLARINLTFASCQFNRQLTTMLSEVAGELRFHQQEMQIFSQ